MLLSEFDHLILRYYALLLKVYLGAYKYTDRFWHIFYLSAVFFRLLYDAVQTFSVSHIEDIDLDCYRLKDRNLFFEGHFVDMLWWNLYDLKFGKV